MNDTLTMGRMPFMIDAYTRTRAMAQALFGRTGKPQLIVRLPNGTYAVRNGKEETGDVVLARVGGVSAPSASRPVGGWRPSYKSRP